MKDKIWLFVLGIRSVDDEKQMPQPELLRRCRNRSLPVAEILCSLLHAALSQNKIEPKGLMYRENLATPLPANFWRDFSAPARLASLCSAPSLRSGRQAYATKSRQKMA